LGRPLNKIVSIKGNDFNGRQLHLKIIFVPTNIYFVNLEKTQSLIRAVTMAQSGPTVEEISSSEEEFFDPEPKKEEPGMKITAIVNFSF
jgi:hypothetical protein